ncbi:MAG: MFS transporter [Propionibacteriaceae bacterium]|nr:MFS transporter [Propionibacteriaceae bacterium]
MSTAGVVLAGWLISTLAGWQVVAVDLVSFCLCGCLCLTVAVPEARTGDQPKRTWAPLADVRMTIRRTFGDRYLRSFVVLMLVLNLAYGFVPQLFPLVLATQHDSAADFGWLRAGIAIGEIVGLIVMERLARHVGILFRLSMIGCGCSVLVASLGLPLVGSVVMLALYGAFDSLSQPLFSHTVMRIPPSERGRVLGGIDGVILLTPTLGILVGSWLAQLAICYAGLFMAVVFAIGLGLVLIAPELRAVKTADSEALQ